jgi:hypothetical protein
LRFSWSITIQEGPDVSPIHGTPEAPKSARKITGSRLPHHAQIRRAGKGRGPAAACESEGQCP